MLCATCYKTSKHLSAASWSILMSIGSHMAMEVDTMLTKKVVVEISEVGDGSAIAGILTRMTMKIQST
jgi:hypothetical protein